MKKLLFIFSFLICAVMAYGQYPNNQNISNNQTRYHIPIMKADSSILLPIKDTLNNLSTFYPGALTVRPQDTIGHVFAPIYMSDGRYWHKIVGPPVIIAPGIDSLTIINNTFCIYSGITITCYPLGNYIDNITLNFDSTFYYLYNGATLLDSIWIPHDIIFGSSTVTITDTTLTVNGVPTRGHIFSANGGGIVFDTAFNFIVSDSLSTPLVLPREGSIFLVGTSPTGQFAGHANEIATRDSVAGIYTFQTAVAGNLLYNATTGFVSQLISGTWVRIGRALLHQSGEDASYGTVVMGSKANFGIDFITNNTQQVNISNTGNVTANNNIIAYGTITTAAQFIGPGASPLGSPGFFLHANNFPIYVTNGGAPPLPTLGSFTVLSDVLSSARGSRPFPAIRPQDKASMELGFVNAQKEYGIGVYNTGNKYLYISDSVQFRRMIMEDANSNVLIGDTLLAVPSAILRVVSTTKGVLFSPMNTAQMNAISSPANGLMIYNTDSACYCSWSGSVWKSMCGGSDGGGGAGSSLANFYLKDSSLSSNRSVDFNGKTFAFNDAVSGNNLFYIDPNPANQQAEMSVYNTDAGGSNGRNILSVNNSDASFSLESSFDNETNIATIHGNADATTSTIQYEAITHTFHGNTFLLDNGAYKPLSIDPPHDTISLRNITATGAESLVKWGDDNGYTAMVEIRSNDPANGVNGDYYFQAGGITGTSIDVSANRRMDYQFLSSYNLLSNTNTVSGNSTSFTQGVNIVDDRPYLGLSAVNVTTGETSTITIIDSSININTPLLRINGVLYGGGSSITQLIGQEFTGSTSTTLTLSQNFISGTIEIWKNGILLNNADFTEAPPNQVTLNVARLSGDMFKINCNY